MAKKHSSLTFLHELLDTPSPTGYEVPIQRVVRSYIEPFADAVSVDLHGNLSAVLNPTAKKKIMLAGHCDQIGLTVKHISKEGFLSVDKLGGVDLGVLYGAKVIVLGKKGPIPGIIGRKPLHIQSADERSKTSHDIAKIWVDIGAKDKADAEKFVELGDALVFEPGRIELKNGLIAGPGLDNRVGLYVVMETLRRLYKQRLQVALFSVSTVQEEVGLRGATTAAHSIHPEVGIAVDVTHANDNPYHDTPKGESCNLGAGPTIARGPNINPIVEERLRGSATKRKIPYQIGPGGGLLGNDANAMQVARGGGVATGALGIPNRYMHTQVEVCHLDDLENAIELLCGFLTDIKATTDFTPR
jgi:endoglucanase